MLTGRLTQGLGIDWSGHGLELWEDLLGEEPEAFFRLIPRHPTVKHVDHQLFQADALLQGLDPIDDIIRGSYGLRGAARGKASVRRTYVGVLAYKVFLIAMDALVARVVPFEVVVLGCGELVVEINPTLFSLLCGLGAVHPQKGGGLVRREAEFASDCVEPPHLVGHLHHVVASDKHLPKTVFGG